MKKSLAIALFGATVFSFSASAHADTLSAAIGGSPLAGSTVYSFAGLTGSTNDTINLGGGTTLSLNDDAAIVTGTDGNNAEPWVGGANGAGDSNPYVSVYGGGGSATFTFATPVTSFGLLWGSVDTDPGRNLVTLSDESSFQGSDIQTLGPSLVVGGQGYGGTVYANITSSTPFTSVTLSDSSSNSFEFDQVSVSPVPLPGAMPMFASAIIGVGLLSRRRRPGASFTG